MTADFGISLFDIVAIVGQVDHRHGVRLNTTLNGLDDLE
jgi:hypothetical protein